MALTLTRVGIYALGGYGTGTVGAWSGNYFASVSNLSYIEFFKRTGDSLTQLTTPDDFEGFVRGVAWNGNYLAVAHSTTPYVSLLRRDGDSLTKLSSPTPPAGSATAVAWTGDYLAVGHATSPYISMYHLSGDTLTKLDSPDPAHAAPAYNGLAWNGDYLVAGFGSSPYQKLCELTGGVLAFVSNNTATTAAVKLLDWSGNYLMSTQASDVRFWSFDPGTEAFTFQSTASGYVGGRWREDYAVLTSTNYLGLFQRQGTNLVEIDGTLAPPNWVAGPYLPAWDDVGDYMSVVYYDNTYTFQLALYKVSDPTAVPSGGITVTGQSPSLPFASPGAGALTFTGFALAEMLLMVEPAAGSLAITGQVPTWQRVTHADLVIELPAIEFRGTVGPRAALSITLPAVSFNATSGGGLAVDLPLLEPAFTGLIGSTASLAAVISAPLFSAESGGGLSVTLPAVEALFTGQVSTTAALVVEIPGIAALFSGTVNQVATLAITLPAIRTLFTSHQQVLGSLVVETPPLRCLFSGSVGEVANLVVTLPALEALFTAYENLTGEMLVTLPAIQAAFEASQTNRFDTTTAAQFDATILKYVRPA